MLRRVLHSPCATLALSAPANEENTAEDPDDVFVPSGIVRTRSFGTFKHDFKLSDATDFIISGTEVCIHMYIRTYIHCGTHTVPYCVVEAHAMYVRMVYMLRDSRLSCSID